MEYERAYLDHPDDWECVSEEYLRDLLDGPYLDVDMAMAYLLEAGTIRTPFATYRVVSESGGCLGGVGAGDDETGLAAGLET